MKVSLERESDVQRAVVHILRVFDCHVVSFPQGRATRQTPGVPDLKVFVPRKRTAFWFECKTAKGVQSADQQVFQRLAEQCQETYCIGGVHEVQEQLRRLGVIAG